MARDVFLPFAIALLILGGAVAIAGLYALHRRRTVYLVALGGTICAGSAVMAWLGVGQ